MSYVIYRKVDGQRLYWRGRRTEWDQPAVSAWRGDAYHFATWNEALAAADTHEELRNSDRWYVAPAGVNGSRT